MKIKYILLPILMVGLMFGSTSTATLMPYELDDEEAYIKCLNNYHQGVVESAIFCVVKMKNSHQDVAYNKIIRVLNRLSHSGDNAAIRYKANLANIYLKNETLMAKLDLSEANDGAEFWTMLVANMSNSPSDWN